MGCKRDVSLVSERMSGKSDYTTGDSDFCCKVPWSFVDIREKHCVLLFEPQHFWYP